MTFSSVIFDWRGTLVTTLSRQQWIEESLRHIGRDHSPARVQDVESALAAVDPDEARLDAPGVDRDAREHRRTYFQVFTDAGFDPVPADALSAVMAAEQQGRSCRELSGSPSCRRRSTSR